MIQWLVFFPVFLFSVLAQAEFVESTLQNDENETVIETHYFTEISQEEPIFPGRKITRDLAVFAEEQYQNPKDMPGRLRVLKEIPYSYAWVSHRTMRLRALAEIEKEESEKPKD
jgi:hypothetical protein